MTNFTFFDFQKPRANHPLTPQDAVEQALKIISYCIQSIQQGYLNFKDPSIKAKYVVLQVETLKMHKNSIEFTHDPSEAKRVLEVIQNSVDLGKTESLDLYQEISHLIKVLDFASKLFEQSFIEENN